MKLRPLVLSMAGLLVIPAGFVNSPVPAAATGPVAPSAIIVETRVKLLPRAEARKRPVLKRGSRGPWVSAVQDALNVRVNGVFNKRTGKAVKRFRKSVGLRPRKKVTRTTWRYLGSRVTPPRAESPAPPPSSGREDWPQLQRGHVSTWVQALQSALGITADGIFGPGTQAAVEDFQRRAGLPVTGIVDTATWQALGSAVTPPPADPTMTALARDSREHRATISVAAFVNSWTARKVVQRESGGNCSITSPNGRYMGKWQMNQDFWDYYGGLGYAPAPHRASCAEQDVIAHRGWVASWWRPWPTAGT